MNIRGIIPTTLILCVIGAAAQTPAAAAREWQAAHRSDILNEFTTLLSIPNVASDTANIQRNADTLVAMLKKRGVEARQLTAPGVPPIVFGEIKSPNAKHTIVFYAHYDGQPVT